MTHRQLEPLRSLIAALEAKRSDGSLLHDADAGWQGPFTVQKHVALPGDRIMWHAIEQTHGIMTPARETRELADHDCTALNAAFILGTYVGEVLGTYDPATSISISALGAKPGDGAKGGGG